jgi:hypothetical protein
VWWAALVRTIVGMSRNSGRVLGWWVLILTGAAAALLIAWLARVVSVPLTTLLTIGAVVSALSWLIVLATVPWNLYFAARRAAAEMAVSRERGISVRAAYDAEAAQISRRMLTFALCAHLATAVAAAIIAYVSGSTAGYYVAGIFLLSTGFRPAIAYVAHVRDRIMVLTRESTHPRDDVATLRAKAERLEEAVDSLRTGLEHGRDDLRARASALADSINHARDRATADLSRLEDAQAVDRAAAHSGDDELSRRIGQMTRRIEAAVDGVSDQQELLSGLRALVRMVRADPS